MDAPTITFDPALPISARVGEITDAIRDHQVVIVAGETGSGKTTQLPKICLLAGREHIGHTQPRRIAARTVAERMAQELGEPLGETVGYQVRFSSNRSAATRVKVMTDGILLAEISHDRDLRRYDTIIVDEAHERSLNIDFLLGYLKQLLPRRPDLRVIVTSATIDTARFSAHFGNAPIIEVSGRTYPVDVRYRPIREGDADAGIVDAITGAIRELARLDGDILVFCSGEREIRDAADAIEAMKLRSTEVLPLFARLSAAEQHKVFASHTGRRIVLATNVAETSVTVPGIRFVVDPGLARVSRYSTRTKVQRLPIEPISQASADQRAGRCGRLGPGVCVRLYSEEDYLARPRFTEPEILRTNLASVILQMADARLGDIERFPFVEAPDQSQIHDGMRLLTELGAIDEQARHGAVRLTSTGRLLARLPVDPRMGRMLVEADRQGCLREVQAIVAGMTIPDVRERPLDQQAKADALHRRFWAPMGGADDEKPTPDGSDIIAYWRLWTYLRDARRELSGNAFRRLCRDEFLNYMRVREWQDLNHQLKQACDELGMHRSKLASDTAAAKGKPAKQGRTTGAARGGKSGGRAKKTAAADGFDRIHVAVLSGLLSHIGLRDDSSDQHGPSPKKRRGPREYRGTRGTRFAINPGSSVAKTQPPLVMAAELVETSRLWARGVAAIEPEWVEEVGGHLIKRSYAEPHWSKRGGQCVAYETVTLLGVPIVSQRLVSYGSIDPVVAREVFIQSALVEGEWSPDHEFWRHNQAVRAEAEDVENRTRRRGLLVDDLALVAFYDTRVPDGIVSAAHFERWWRDQARVDPHLLDLTLDDLLESTAVDVEEFPTTWTSGRVEWEVSYTFEPGADDDGVTVDIPLGQLNQADAADFTWQVPGLREPLAVELIRGLPKKWRAQLVPAPATARAALAWLRQHPVDHDVPFSTALGQAVLALTGVMVPEDAWRPDAVADHLRMRFRVRTATGDWETGRELDELRQRLAPQVKRSLNKAAAHVTHASATSWAFGELPHRVGGEIVGFPALADRVDGVSVEVFADEAAAARSHRAGLRRLVALTTVDPTLWVVSRLTNAAKLPLATSPYASVPALLADARLKAIGDLMDERGGLTDVRGESAFDTLASQVRTGAAERMRAVVNTAADTLAARGSLLSRCGEAPERTRRDLTTWLDGLVYPGFIAATPEPWYERLPVYLTAALRRIDQARDNPARDVQRLDQVLDVEDRYGALADRCPPGPLPVEVAEIGWLIEEYRVSVFAQSLRTLVPVSAKRLASAMDAVEPR